MNEISGDKVRRMSLTHEMMNNGFTKEFIDITSLERAIIGNALCHGRKYVKIISELMHPEHFPTEKYRELWCVILEMNQNDIPIDILSVVNELSKQGRLTQFGGAYEISILSGLDICSIPSIVHYARLLHELFIDRSIKELALEAHNLADNKSLHPLDKMTQIELKIRGVRKLLATGRNVSTNDQAKAVTAKIIHETVHKMAPGITTSYPALDEMATGLIPAEFTIIAGRPGMGKTAFVMCMAIYIAYTLKSRIIFFSREMKAEQLIIRIISILTGIGIKDIRKRNLTPKQLETIEAVSAMITDVLVIDDSTITVEEMESKAIRLIDEGGLALMIVDYIQLCETTQTSKSREQEISQISRKLKRTANDNNIPVIGLSQLSRETEKRSGTKQQNEPQLSDLRESGSLEQDADNVWLLYRPEYYKHYNDDKGNSMRGKVKVIVAKQRNGETGSIWLDFDAKHAQFLSQKKEDTPGIIMSTGDNDNEEF